MLKHLKIRQFAIIDQLELDFANGMTAITGETGAGKSILLGALSMVLGDRADAGSVRQGAERADVSASFVIQTNQAVQNWLQQQELDLDDECLIRRTINADGRSKAYINGTPVTLNLLRELADQLVDIHGQHEHQSLLRVAVQRQRLDAYAQCSQLATELRQCYRTWYELEQQLTQIEQQQAQRIVQQAVLQQQIAEFAQLALEANEWEELLQQQRRLSHLQNLLAATESALQQLYEDDLAAYTLIQRQARQLMNLTDVDAALMPITANLETASVHLQDAVEQLRDYLTSLDIDPAELTAVEQRISAIHAMARKYQTTPELLPETALNWQQQYQQLQHSDQDQEQQQLQRTAAAERYQQLANELSEKRNLAAKKLSSEISAAMQTLGMTGGQFAIQLTPRADAMFYPEGRETIEFQVSANPGQALQPLNKVASGGELARISLAIQIITVLGDPIPTLVFDEVDAGVGGAVAEIVGRYLAELGQQRQVLCVTHLPQVAAQAQQQLHVYKSQQQNQTQTLLKLLTAEQRIEEIARMLGGVNITATTRAHATEMLAAGATS